MRRFQAGQQVVCVHPTGMWLGVFPGPYYGDIVTVSRYSEIHKDSIELVEYPVSRAGYPLPECFTQIWFNPLADLKELELENYEPQTQKI